MKYPFFKSIRVYLLFLVLISVLPALGIIIYSGMDRNASDIEVARENTLRVMHNLAHDHERTITSTRQFLMTLAQVPDVQNQNVPACNKLFRALHKSNPLYSTILAANAEGMVFASAVPVAPFSIRKRKYFPEILQTKELAVGDYMIGVASGIPVLPIAYPVLDSKGQIKGFVIVGLDLDRYDRMFKETKLPDGSVLAISDHKHIRLNRYPDPINYIGKADIPEMIKLMSARPEEGTFTAVGGDGISRVYAYKRFYLKNSKTPYLFMRVGISEETVLSGARKKFLINMALLCSALVSVMVLAWHLGKILIVQRIDELTDATRRLRNGDLTIRTGLVHKEDELGQLAGVFDEMADKLEHKDSERRLAEKALQESEERYRTLIETTRDLVYTTDRRGFLIYLNPMLLKTLGYAPNELTGVPFTQIIVPEYIDKLRNAFKMAMRGESVPVYETELIRKDGTRIFVEFNATTLFDKEGKPTGRYGIGRDITERKQMEEKIRNAAAEWSTTFDAMKDSVVLLDVDNTIRRCNRAFTRLLGKTYEEIIDRECCQLVHGSQWLIDPCPFHRMLISLKREESEWQLNGRWCGITVDPIFDTGGLLTGAVYIVTDIDQRKKSEETIQKAEQKYRNLFMNAQEGIYQTSQEGILLTVNPAMANIYGYASTEEMLSAVKNVAQQLYLHQEDRNEYKMRMQADGIVKDFEVRHKRKDGTPIWIMSKGRSVHDDNGHLLYYEGTVVDITNRKLMEDSLIEKNRELESAYEELKQAQARVIQQEKMASIGQLAAGITHEINNPMSFVTGNLGILQTYIDGITETIKLQDEIVKAHATAEAMDTLQSLRKKMKVDYILKDIGNLIGQSLEGTNRVRKIIADLKSFSRMEEDIHMIEDINSGLESTINIVWNEIKYKAELVKEYGELPLTKCNISQINQVFMNLLVNAAQAIEKWGKITVKTWSDESNIYVSVTDTGSGIPEANQKKIFDPFFTTKEKGEGTGLGLSISLDIVRKHGGEITLDSEVSKGTTFTVRIPITGS